jgi:hypothetical protein
MTQASLQAETLQYAGIQFTRQHVSEISGSSISLRVPQSDIKQIRLIFAAQSPYPIVSIIVGFALVGLGLFPIVHIANWLRHGGTLIEMELLLAGFIPIGISLIYHGLARRYLLVIQDSSGMRRLAFSKSAELVKIRELIQQAEREFGYRIKVDV